jgi:hypothetical protein
VISEVLLLLHGRQFDHASNATLAAVGYNFRRLIQWLRALIFRILIAASFAVQLKSA